MSNVITPEVLWAQRSSDSDPKRNYLLLTIGVRDCESPKLDLKPGYLEFTANSPGHVGDESAHSYRLHIDFYKDIIPEDSLNKVANGQDYFLKLYKKDLDSEYWPRLTKEKLKYHFIKTDFDKWVDEDEQEEHVAEDNGFNFDPQDESLQQLLRQSGGGGLEGLEDLKG